MTRRLGPTTARLRVKVVAGASRNSIAGWQQERLKVHVAAAPERGRANQALQALIASSLDLPTSAVHVVSGHTSALKTLEIDGLESASVMSRLGRPGAR